MSRLSPEWALLLTALIGIACAGRSQDADTRTRSSPGWYEIARTPEIVAYIDTARVEKRPEGVARVWFRFHYLTPIQLGKDTATKYAAAETRQEVDCPHRRTRGLETRLETTTGLSAASPTPDTAWSSIDTHILNSGIFLVACRATGHPIRPAADT